MKRFTFGSGDRIRMTMPDGLWVEVPIKYVAGKVAKTATHAPVTVGIEHRELKSLMEQYSGDPTAPPRRKK